MNIRQYFLTAVVYLVFALATLISVRWLREAYTRDKIRKQMEHEAFSITGSTSVSADIVKMSNNAAVLEIQDAINKSHHLNTYIVKSSHNTAFGGTIVSIENISYILSRGCRLVDFEVFSGADGSADADEVLVAFSRNTTKSGYNITSSGRLSLYDALKTVFAGAFAAPAPNPRDPIFLRLRLNRPSGNESQYLQMCRMVRGAIITAIPTRLYRGAVSGKTMLQSLSGKIVLILDTVPDPDLAALAAITIGTDIAQNTAPVMRAYTYSELSAQAASPTSSALRIATTDRADVSNADYAFFFKNYGVQFGEMDFYTPDNALKEYEMLFNHFKSAFVSIPAAVEYLKTLE